MMLQGFAELFHELVNGGPGVYRFTWMDVFTYRRHNHHHARSLHHPTLFHDQPKPFSVRQNALHRQPPKV